MLKVRGYNLTIGNVYISAPDTGSNGAACLQIRRDINKNMSPAYQTDNSTYIPLETMKAWLDEVPDDFREMMIGVQDNRPEVYGGYPPAKCYRRFHRTYPFIYFDQTKATGRVVLIENADINLISSTAEANPTSVLLQWMSYWVTQYGGTESQDIYMQVHPITDQ